MKRFIFILSIVAFAILGNAQETKKKKQFISVYGTNGLHYFTDISAINNAFKSNGLPVFSNSIPVSHSGISFGVNRFLFQFDEHIYDLRGREKGNYSLNASGEGYGLRIGYNLLTNSSFDLYPYAGIGFQEQEWVIDKQIYGSLSDVIKAPNTSSYNLSSENQDIASIGIILNVRLFSFLKEKADFLFGGDIHYLYCSTDKWRLNDNVVDVGKVDLGGFSWMVNLTLKVRIDKVTKSN